MRLAGVGLGLLLLGAQSLTSIALAADDSVLFPARDVSPKESLVDLATTCAPPPANFRGNSIPCTAAARNWLKRTWAKSNLPRSQPLLVAELSEHNPQTRQPSSCKTTFPAVEITISPGDIEARWERSQTLLRYVCGDRRLQILENELFLECESFGELDKGSRVEVSAAKVSVNGVVRKRGVGGGHNAKELCLKASFVDSVSTQVKGHTVTIAPGPSELSQTGGVLSWNGGELRIAVDYAEFNRSKRVILKPRQEVHLINGVLHVSEPSDHGAVQEITQYANLGAYRVVVFPRSTGLVTASDSRLVVGETELTLAGDQLNINGKIGLELLPGETIVVDHGAVYLKGQLVAKSESTTHHEHHH